MTIFTDSFPPPSLDVARWTEDLQGTVSLVVGIPTDGVYPIDVDNAADEVAVHSRTKIYVPTNQPFDSQINYIDPYADAVPPVTRILYFGWRSILEGAGIPLWGVDVMLRILIGPGYDFLKRVVVNGVTTVTPLIADPTAGADGKFRVERTGYDYKIYYYDGGWVLLDTITLAHIGLGYVRFGVYAEAVAPPAGAPFPWILEP